MTDCCPIKRFVLYTCSKLLHTPASGDKLLACELAQHEHGLFTLKAYRQMEIHRETCKTPLLPVNLEMRGDT